MKEIWSKIWVPIFTLVLGAFLGILGNRFQDSYTNQIRYLDVVTNSYALVSRPDIGENLEILFDTKPIDALGRVTIDIYNRTDQDFENVPVYIDLTPLGNNDFKIVRSEAVAAHNIPAPIALTPIDPSKNNIRATRMVSTISTANRSPILPIVTITLLIIGKEPPDVSVATQKKGLQMGAPQKWLSEKKKWWQAEFFITLMVIIGITLYISIYPIAMRIINKLVANTVEAKRKKMNENIIGMIKEDGFANTPAIEKIVENTLYFEQKIRWDNVPKLVRWIIDLKEPKR